MSSLAPCDDFEKNLFERSIRPTKIDHISQIEGDALAGVLAQ